MTEAEALELVTLYVDTAGTSFGLYATFTFAYLTVAYFVGVQLTTFQVRLISCIYVGSAGVTAMSCYAMVHGWIKVYESTPTILEDIAIFRFGAWHIFMGFLLASGIAMSLYFMHDVRKKSAEQDVAQNSAGENYLNR